MNCQKCGQPLKEVCFNCLGYVFNTQAKVTIASEDPRISRIVQDHSEIHKRLNITKAHVGYWKVGTLLVSLIAIAFAIMVIQPRTIERPGPIPDVDVSRREQTILNDTVVLNWQFPYSKDFIVDYQMRDAKVAGYFSCQQCPSGHSVALILDESNYRRFRRNNSYRVLYESPIAQSGGIDIRLAEGRYYLVFHTAPPDVDVWINADIRLSYR